MNPKVLVERSRFLALVRTTLAERPEEQAQTSTSARSHTAVARFVSALLVVAGAGCLHLGFKSWGDLSGFSLGPVTGFLALYALAFACIVAAIGGLPERLLAPVTRSWEVLAAAADGYFAPGAVKVLRLLFDYGAFIAVGVIVGRRMLTRYGVDYFGTDGLVFAQYSVDNLFAGKNPYSLSMAEAFQRHASDPSFGTYRIDGSLVTELSYPAMSVLAFVPQYLLGIPNFDLTSLVVLLLLFWLLVAFSPTPLKWFPPLMLWAEWGLVSFTSGGVFDILWALPLVVAMLALARRRRLIAGVLFGVACATKQTPWFVAPFICLWLVLESRGARDAAKSVLQLGGAAGLTFLAINAPFIVVDPAAWLRGVLVPVVGGVPLVELGGGPVMLDVAGITHQPKIFFSLLMAEAFALVAIAYWLWFSRLKWLAWCAPMLVLWFNYRSLHNYYVYLLPAAYMGVLLKYAADDAPRPTLHRAGLLFTGAVAVAVIAVLVASSVLATRVQLPGRLELLRSTDVNALGRVSEIEVRLSNDGTEPLSPTFGVVHSRHQTPVHWQVKSGPATLAPAESATYVLTAPIPTATIPFAAAMHLRAYQRGTEKRVSLVRQPMREPGEPQPVVSNPRFRDWVINAELGRRQPFLWVARVAPPATRIEEVPDGVRVTIAGRADARGEPLLLRSGIEQALRTKLHGLFIDATPHTVTDTPERAGPSAGLELRAPGHCIAIVFASLAGVYDTRRGRTVCKVIALAAVDGERVATTVDLGARVGNDFLAHFYRGDPKARLFAFAAIASDGRDATASVVFHDVHEIPSSLREHTRN